MTERPILFTGEMVRQVLADRKTQTRRVVKHVPAVGGPDRWCAKVGDPEFERIVGDFRRFCPYGQPGDLLWVRETHAIVPATAYRSSREPDGGQVAHRLSPDGHMWSIYRQGWTRARCGPWRPSIHMPRWASRLTLRVTDVRVERVQDIGLGDIQAEGVELPERPGSFDITEHWIECRRRWRELWDSINGRRPGCSWADNPWTWAVSFERVTT